MSRTGSIPRRRAFSLIELLVVVAVIAILAGVLLPVLAQGRQHARRIQCLNNLRQFLVADLMYSHDFGELPSPNPFVPSTLTVARLTAMAAELKVGVPPGPAGTWPKRAEQPKWINCPLAADSGLAEGVVLGGGLYTGYAYYGGVEECSMVTNGFARVVNSGQAADAKNTRRGVLWTDVLDEFATSDPRRFEFFHVRRRVRYPDFRFHAGELDGVHRGWSDGSVEWVPGRRMALSGPTSPDCRLQHILGNFYF